MDKEKLLTAVRLTESDVELPGLGTVRVRALDRDEAIATAKIEDLAMRDRHIIAIGLIDPKMSVSEVAQWGKIRGAAGEMERVSREIGRLSGLREDSEKAAYKSIPDES